MSLKNYSDSDLEQELIGRRLERAKPIELPAPYNNPVGFWEVTTEGDCEGRTTTTLGTFRGHIVDIAFALASKAYYALTFTAVTEDTPETVTKHPEHANIVLNINSGTWYLTEEQRAVAVEHMLRKAPHNIRFKGVRRGDSHASSRIEFRPYEEQPSLLSKDKQA